MSYRHMICFFIEFNKSAVIYTFVVCSVEVHTISITSYRVIQPLDVYRKLNWGSAFYYDVAEPINFATTNKLFDNNIVTA